MRSPSHGFGSDDADAPLITGSVGSVLRLKRPLIPFARLAKPDAGFGLGDLPRLLGLGTSRVDLERFLIRPLLVAMVQNLINSLDALVIF